VIDGERFDFWRDDEGTIVADFSRSITTAVSVVASASNSSTSNYGGIQATSANQPQTIVQNDSVVQANIIGGSLSTGSLDRLVMALKADDYALYKNGVAIGSDTSGAMVSGVDRFLIGGVNGASMLNGHIRTLLYYPQRLSNAQIEALSVVGQDYPRKSFDPYSLVRVTDGTARTAVALDSMNGAIIEL